MKVGTAILVCVACLGLMACGDDAGPSKTPEPGGTASTDAGNTPAAGKTLTYTPPNGWTLKEKPEDGIASRAWRAAKGDEPYPPNITLSHFGTILAPKTLEAWAEMRTGQIQRYQKDAKVLSNKAVRIGDLRAWEILFTCTAYLGFDVGEPFRVHELLVLAPGTSYTWTAGALASQEADNALVAAAAKTLRWE